MEICTGAAVTSLSAAQFLVQDGKVKRLISCIWLPCDQKHSRQQPFRSTWLVTRCFVRLGLFIWFLNYNCLPGLIICCQMGQVKRERSFHSSGDWLRIQHTIYFETNIFNGNTYLNGTYIHFFFSLAEFNCCIAFRWFCVHVWALDPYRQCARAGITFVSRQDYSPCLILAEIWLLLSFSFCVIPVYSAIKSGLNNEKLIGCQLLLMQDKKMFMRQRAKLGKVPERFATFKYMPGLNNSVCMDQRFKFTG